MPSIGDGPTNSYAAELGSHNAIYHPEGVNVTNLNPSHIFTSRQQSTVARWFGEIFAKKSDAFANTVHDRTASPYTGRFLIMTPRVDPKVFFANERTFLAWLHVSVFLAGASVALMALTESDVDYKYTISKQIYGVALLPISIAFILYAMLQYSRRASMIRRAAPGVWLDVSGPMALSIILSLALVSQFAIKIYSLM